MIATPAVAQAQEIAQLTPAAPIAPTWIAPREIDLTPAQAVALAEAAPIAPLSAAPKPILSRGAKVAIIVGAIVGGILIIFGVFVLAKPPKP